MHLTTPLTMMGFFRKSEGTWFTQRAVHHFDSVEDESGESNLTIEVLNKNDPRVQEICDSQGIDPNLATGGASFAWQVNLDIRELSSGNAAILVDVPDTENTKIGKLIRNQGYVETIPVVSRYNFTDEGVLTIDTNYDNNQGQERCWFINDDFRVRVSSVRMMNGINLMTYCSERRCVSDDTLKQMIEANKQRLRN
ncbi:MAG: phycobiliprotein lyase [Methylacidiphilales bacterium]|nr:phycobiliprotein lyase [Candidatus Methylacidiphilales bacterium]NJR17005.1 phycobiliprotein lyase [Calothrix sp. CSU_2_0]